MGVFVGSVVSGPDMTLSRAERITTDNRPNEMAGVSTMHSGLVNQVFDPNDQRGKGHGPGGGAGAPRSAGNSVLNEAVDQPRLWTVLEKLKAQANPTLPAAQMEVQSLLVMSSNPDAREEIMRALRTEEPVHFKYPEIRAAALNALSPYVVEDKSLLPVFIEELEDHPEYSEPRKIALAVINGVDEIKDKDYANRLLRLVTREGSEEAIKEISEQLHPHIKVGVCSSDFIEELKNKVITGYETPRESQDVTKSVKALAVCRDCGAIELLAKFAKQDVFAPYGFHEASSKVEGIQALTALTALGGVVGSLGTGSLLPLAIGLGGGVGIFSVGIPLAVQLYNQHKKRIENEDVASKAGRALIYSMPDIRAELEVLHILDNPKTPGSVRQAIVGGLREEVRQVARPDAFIFYLSNSTATVREALLGALANNRGRQVEEAVHKCTHDSDTNVRRLAYEIIDSWKTTEKKKDNDGTASLRGCP